MTKPIDQPNEWRILLLKVLERLKRDGQTLEPTIRHASIEEGKELIINTSDIKPGDPPQITVTSIGIVVADQQGLAIHRLDGSITTASGGNIETTKPAISRIELHDLRLVTGHAITTVHETVSHHIQFVGGGSFSFMMDGNGKVLETVNRDIHIRSDGEGVIRLLGSATGADDTGPDND